MGKIAGQNSGAELHGSIARQKITADSEGRIGGQNHRVSSQAGMYAEYQGRMKGRIVGQSCGAELQGRMVGKNCHRLGNCDKFYFTFKFKV